MDAVHNPYSPGAGRRPPALVGRDFQINAIDVLLHRAAIGRTGQGLILSGLRGVGKTVLLNELAGRAQGADWIVSKVEAHDTRPFLQRSAPVWPELYSLARSAL